MFLKRAYTGAGTPPTLDELWAGAEMAGKEGRDESYSDSVSLSNIPASGTYYCFSFHDGEMNIDKIKDRAKTNLLKTGRNTLLYAAGGTVYLSRTGASAAAVCGGTLALVSFPAFDEGQVDTLLMSLTLSQAAGQDKTVASYISMSVGLAGACDVVFAAAGNVMSVYLAPNTADIPEPVFSTGTYGALGYVSNMGYSLRKSGSAARTRVYGGSIIGLNTV